MLQRAYRTMSQCVAGGWVGKGVGDSLVYILDDSTVATIPPQDHPSPFRDLIASKEHT